MTLKDFLKYKGDCVGLDPKKVYLLKVKRGSVSSKVIEEVRDHLATLKIKGIIVVLDDLDAMQVVEDAKKEKKHDTKSK